MSTTNNNSLMNLSILLNGTTPTTINPLLLIDQTNLLNKDESLAAKTVLEQKNFEDESENLDCWPVDATSILFQLAYICLLIAYLAPSGKYCLLFIHLVLAIAHLLITIWVSKICFTIPSLLGWSITFLCLNVIRVGIQLYTTRHIKFPKELEEIYEELFCPVGVSREKFKKLVAQGKLITVHSGEAYALEKVTPTNRLSLLITGKINVTSRNHFLHSIKPGEFLDSPEWESGVGYAKRSNDIFEQQRQQHNQKRNLHFGGSNSESDTKQLSEFEPLTMMIDQIDPSSGSGGGGTGSASDQTTRDPPENRFNVTLIAATQCRIICWNRMPLEYHMAKDRQIFKVLNLILGRDITNKLYAMNEKIIAEKGSMLDIRLPVIISSWTKHLDNRKNLESAQQTNNPTLTSNQLIPRLSLSSTNTTTNNHWEQQQSQQKQQPKPSKTQQNFRTNDQQQNQQNFTTVKMNDDQSQPTTL